MFNLSRKIGIDLGTANSLVFVEKQGIVLNEPTVVAVTIEERRVVAVGNEAKEMLGRTPGDIVASRPMRDGVIADYVVTEAMLRYFLDKVTGRSHFFKPEVMICAPAGVTSVEKRAVLDAMLSAGAKEAFLIDESLAAAIGAGIPVGSPSGNMIVDIGGGTEEVAVIALGGTVVHNTVRVGGNKLDEAIAQFVKRKHNLYIGERMAEEIKLKVGSALPLDTQLEIEVRGRDTVGGLPRSIVLTSDEVTEAITPLLQELIAGIRTVFEQTPPELAADIYDKGLVLSGGTALLRNLDRLFTESLGVPAHVIEKPMQAVVRGTGIALTNLDKYKRSISKQ